VEKVKQRQASGRGNFNAILMDFVMPNMDGPTSTTEMRKMGYDGSIFGLTGNGLQSDIDHFVSNGVDSVFVKPLNLPDFERAVSRNVLKK
jgi:CheY-like chemotaxis protein